MCVSDFNVSCPLFPLKKQKKKHAISQFCNSHTNNTTQPKRSKTMRWMFCGFSVYYVLFYFKIKKTHKKQPKTRYTFDSWCVIVVCLPCWLYFFIFLKHKLLNSLQFKSIDRLMDDWDWLIDGLIDYLWIIDFDKIQALFLCFVSCVCVFVCFCVFAKKKLFTGLFLKILFWLQDIFAVIEEKKKATHHKSIRTEMWVKNIFFFN